MDSVFTGDNEDIIIEEIKRANVICLVYAVDDIASFERVEKYWLPLLKRLCEQHVPVILAGNKIDEGKDVALTDAKVDAIVNAYHMVEVSVFIRIFNSDNLRIIFRFQLIAVPRQVRIYQSCSITLRKLFYTPPHPYTLLRMENSMRSV